MIHRYSFESKGKEEEAQERKKKKKKQSSIKIFDNFCALGYTYITIRVEEVEEGTQPSDDNFLDWLFKL